MTGTVLRANRDFRLLWTGQLASTLAGSAASLALPLLVLASTGSPTQAGLTGMVLLTVNAMVTLPSGAIADRLPGRVLLVGTDLGRVVTMAVLATAILLDRAPLWLILLIAATDAVLASLFRAAESPTLRRIMPAEHLSTALARNQTRLSLAGFLGPPLGGLLLGVDPAWPFLANAAAHAFSAATILAIATPLPAGNTKAGGNRRAELTAGVVFLWRDRFLRTALFTAAGVNLAFGGIYVVTTVGGADQGTAPLTIGLTVALAAGGGLLGAALAGRLHQRLSARAAFLTVLAGGAVLVPLMGIAPHPVALGLLFGACMILPPILSVVVGTTRMLRTPQELQGRVATASGLIAMSAAPLGPLTAGLLIDHTGTTTAYLAFGGLLAVLAAVCALSPALRVAERQPDHSVSP